SSTPRWRAGWCGTRSPPTPSGRRDKSWRTSARTAWRLRRSAISRCRIGSERALEKLVIPMRGRRLTDASGELPHVDPSVGQALNTIGDSGKVERPLDGPDPFRLIGREDLGGVANRIPPDGTTAPAGRTDVTCTTPLTLTSA